MKPNGIFILSLGALFFSASSQAEETRVHILQNLNYHADEVADVKSGETWVAIVKSNRNYSAKQVTISVKTVKDEVIDPENGPYTGKQVTSDPAAIFLIKGIPLKTGTRIESYPVDTAAIEGDKAIEIKGGYLPLPYLEKINSI